MQKLIKHLKPFTWLIVAIFLLLFAQAMSDLSLPSYMSNIVNVGIQQGGVENSVPLAIRASEYTKLTLFMTDGEKAQVTADYILLDKQSLSAGDYAKYLKTYPQLATTSIYKLNTNDKSEIAQMNTVFSKYIPMVADIEQNGIAHLYIVCQIGQSDRQDRAVPFHVFRSQRDQSVFVKRCFPTRQPADPVLGAGQIQKNSDVYLFV